MARDRKRAKQRQRKRAGQQRPQQQREPRPARVPDGEPAEQLEPLEELEPLEPLEPLDEPVDPDGPLGQAAPDAEIAELAEAGLQEPGAPVGRPLEEKDYPHPDELEGADAIQEDEDLESAAAGGGGRRGGRRGGKGSDGGGGDGARTPSPAGRELPREGNRFINFLRACVAELRRVQWPDRRQVGQATAVVLVFVVIAGSYLGLLDALFSRVVDAIL
jgi:preprotein translocase subunit SecE